MVEPLRIAYLSGNDVLSDARVLKFISAAEDVGHDVVAVGITRHGAGAEMTVGRSRVIVQGTTPTARERLASKWREVRVVLRLGYRGPDEHRAARGQVARWRTTAQSKRGWRRAVMAVVATGGAVWSGLVGRLSRGSDAADGPASVESDDRSRARQVAALVDGARPGWWSTVLPVLERDDERIGPLLDELEPDVVHVHDVFMLAVGARAVARARAAGREAHLVYDAHEYVRGLSHLPVRTVAAYTQLEREFIGRADRVVTVSEPLADLLVRDHGLTRRPAVMLNAPMVASPPAGHPTLRSVTGVPAGAPLLVYGGGVNTARGVDTAVRALAGLPGAHLAVVTNRVNYVVRALLELAEDLGVADRLHLADYVEPRFVAHYFSDATIGLSTLLRSPNHDVALTNKFCEYLQAGLPIVTSDTPAQEVLVRELDLGAVYRAGDAESLTTAVREVLGDVERLQARIRDDAGLRARFGWPAQAALLGPLYEELVSSPDRARGAR